MSDETQVLVRFVTKLPQELRVPPAEVAVPASLKRYGLSQIINHLLALDPPRPFDFIIDGELVRKTLEQHLLEHAVSPEAVVEVEYVPAVVPPEVKEALPQDDWVRGLSAASSSRLVTGCYDGLVRLMDESGQCILSFAAHTDGVNAVESLPTTSGSSQPLLVLSGGKDAAVKLWQLEEAASGSAAKRGGGGSARCVAVGVGHSEAVQGLANNPGGSQAASCGWDSAIHLWRTGAEVVQEAAEAAAAAAPADGGAKKKLKSSGAGAVAVPAPLQLQPAATLEGHKQCVSGLAWTAPGELFSGGWDHSVRRWDVETRVNVDTLNGSKAVFALAAPSGGGGGGGPVAFGGADGAVRLWDPRARRGEALAVSERAGHGGWVTGLAWRPGSESHFASCSHDGRVRLWDVRSPVALAALDGHSGKALCVAWWGPARMASGGADCKVVLYQLAEGGGAAPAG